MNKKPIMLIAYKEILSDNAYKNIIEGFEKSSIKDSYDLLVLEQQDKAEVRIITDHLDKIWEQ